MNHPLVWTVEHHLIVRKKFTSKFSCWLAVIGESHFGILYSSPLFKL